MAAWPACRGSDVHSVFPVLASTLKYWPLFFVVRPKIASRTRTLLLKRYGMSAFSHAVSVVHWLFCLLTLTAVVGPPFPETMSVCSYTIGVTAFVEFELTKGRSHNTAPVAGSTLISLPWVIVTSWRVPPRSATTGEPYPGPSPFQLHLMSPVLTSNAVKAPSLCPPT